MIREQQESLDRGIDLFNEQRFFEAHEEWEQEWRLMGRGGERDFFQGLIMAAASLYHYLQHECVGARSLLKKSMEYLKAGIDGHRDIGVTAVIKELERLQQSFDACTFVASGRLPVIRRNTVAWRGWVPGSRTREGGIACRTPG